MTPATLDSGTGITGGGSGYVAIFSIQYSVIFGARGMSSVRYRTRLGDLKNKQSTERESLMYTYMDAGIGCTFLTMPTWGSG